MSRFKLAAAVMLLAVGLADLIVVIFYFDSPARRFVQVALSVTLFVWSFAYLLDYRARRRAEQNTL